MVLVEPTITVRVNTDFDVVAPTVRDSPPGVLWKRDHRSAGRAQDLGVSEAA